jgi:tetratricopeptide (TPR) repeat protein
MIMRLQHSLILLGATVFLLQPTFAQSWGQLKSQALEAQQAKKYPEAVEGWNKALSACENKTGPRYVQSLAGLAQTYADQEKYSDADECYKKIIEIANAGSPSDECKAALLDYTAMLRKQKKDGEAQELETKYALQAKQPEPEKPKYVDTKAELKAQREKELKAWQELMASAEKEQAQKHYPQTEQMLKQAIAAAGKQDRLCQDSVTKLIDVYSAQNKLNLAEPLYAQLLGHMARTSGGGSKDYAHVLMAHGLLLRKMNRKPEAIAEEGKAERILAQANDTNNNNNNSAGSFPSGSAIKSDSSGTRHGSLVDRARTARDLQSNTDQLLKEP